MLVALIDGEKIVRIETVDSEEDVIRLMSQYPVVRVIDGMSPMPEVGWLYENSELVDPLLRSPAKRISKLGFRQRFTFTELILITTAAQTSVPLQVLLENLRVATFIDLARADTAGGIGLIVSMGLVTSDRAAQILNNPITEVERYKGE